MIGARVLLTKKTTQSYSKLGQYIYGASNLQRYGSSVSINSDGNRIIIGNSGNTAPVIAGTAIAYSWDGTTWTKMGATFTQEATNDTFGCSVSMNSVGDRVAIGAPTNDGGGVDSGSVRIYSWDGTTWTKLGLDIDGEAADAQSGSSVSMNSVGDRVAIGAPNTANGGTSQGSAVVYSIS